MQRLLYTRLSDRRTQPGCRVAVADEFSSNSSARADVGYSHSCNRSSRSATASLLRFIFRGDTRRSLSPFSENRVANPEIFCCAAHPHETEISGPRLMDWARLTFRKPILDKNRDETLEKIRGWLNARSLRPVALCENQRHWIALQLPPGNPPGQRFCTSPTTAIGQPVSESSGHSSRRRPAGARRGFQRRVFTQTFRFL